MNPPNRAARAADLVAGPRGRRLALALALDGGPTQSQPTPLATAVFDEAFRIEQARGDAVTRFGWGTLPPVAERTPAKIAALVDAVQLGVPTRESLIGGLVASVDAARYWQEPDGTDVLCATPEMRAALLRVAENLLHHPDTFAWSAPFDAADQWQLTWDDAPPFAAPDLAAWRAEAEAEEARAQRERPADPSANWTACWWSHPPHELRSSTPSWGALGPVGLWLVEDALGWENATAQRLAIEPGARVYEIDGPEAWAALCREFPLEVTASKRHDWFRTTGRAGRWVMPDWSRVAERYDGVHLTIAGYLAAATMAIPVSDDTASVIAGWGPGTTWWLTDVVRPAGEPVRWRIALDDHGVRRATAL